MIKATLPVNNTACVSQTCWENSNQSYKASHSAKLRAMAFMFMRTEGDQIMVPKSVLEDLEFSSVLATNTQARQSSTQIYSFCCTVKGS